MTQEVHMKRVVTFLLCLLVVSPTLRAQERSVDYNEYYRFPLSIGIEYQSLSPFTEYKKNYSIFEFATNILIPIPTVPSVQPYLRLGMMSFDSLDETYPEKWDHLDLSPFPVCIVAVITILGTAAFW